MVVSSLEEVSEIVRVSLIATAVGLLFIVAAGLMSGSLRVEVALTREDEAPRGRRHTLQKLAASYGLEKTGDADDIKSRILGHLWAERSQGGRIEPLEEVGAELLVEHLATPRPELGPGHLKSFNRETLRLLVQESKSLLALAKLFNLDQKLYGRTLRRVRQMMRNGNLEDCIQLMQSANDRLRTRLEAQVTKDW